jgi:hypothetical protein
VPLQLTSTSPGAAIKVGADWGHNVSFVAPDPLRHHWGIDAVQSRYQVIVPNVKSQRRSDVISVAETCCE